MTKSILLAASTLALATASTAAPIAVWTVESATPADLVDNVAWGPFAADTGAGTFTALHASALTDWTTPSGNGSVNSYSANNWGVGDYFQFQVNTSGQTGVYLSFDQTGSSTGPRDFKVAYSTDGTNFTDLTSYQVLINGAPNASWNSATASPVYNSGLLVAPASGFDNQATLYLRLVDNSTTAINGGTVAVGGTGRVDNVTVGLLADVPEPTSLAALALGSMLALRRRNG